MMPVVAFGMVREARLIHSDVVLVVALVAASTVGYELVLLAGVMLTGGVLDMATALSRAVVPAVIVNLAITAPVYAVMRVAKPHGDRHRLSAY